MAEGRLFDAVSFQEFFVLVAVAVEDVDVNFAADACHAAIGRQLPDGESHVGFILAVAGNPHLVVALYIGSIGEVLRDETLVHVEDWAHADLLLHDLQPGADAALRTNARAEARTQAELAVLRASARLRTAGYAPGDAYPEVELSAAPDAAETADGTVRVLGYAVEVRSSDPAWRDGTAVTVYAPARTEGAP